MNISFTLAWRNLWRHKRRTWLTVGAMIFSNFLLVFMITVQFGSYDMMIENGLKAFSGHLQIAKPGYQEEMKMRQTLPAIQALAQRVRNTYPELKVAPRAATFVLASSEERSFGIQVVGVDSDHEPTVSSIPGLVKEGRYLNPSSRDEIIIGRVLARNLKANVGDEITLLGSGLDSSFAAAIVKVVGIYESGIADIDRSIAQLSLPSFQSMFAMNDAGHNIIINAPNISASKDYQQKIKALINNAAVMEVLNWQELHPEIKQAIQTDLASAWFMYGVLVILVSFSVLNTQLMSVLERTKEFGIMMAIGLRAGRLARLILVETTTMAAVGFVLGSALGFILVLYLNQNGFSFPGMEGMAEQYNLPDKMYPSLSPLAIFLGPCVVFIGCLLASIYPALRLFVLQPVTAMRSA